MEKKHQGYGFLFIFSMIISLGLVSFISCVIAETQKSKRKDVKVDGKLCELAGSHAYGLGIAALICLAIAQIIGNLLICRIFLGSRNKTNICKTQKPKIAIAGLLVLSWISLGLAVILISAATSMNKRQEYGKGWLDQECYVVKDGVFVSSGGLVLVSLASMMAVAITSQRKDLR